MGKTLLSDFHPTIELPTSSSAAAEVGIVTLKEQFTLIALQRDNTEHEVIIVTSK
jgi:hypothetical protein